MLHLQFCLVVACSCGKVFDSLIEGIESSHVTCLECFDCDRFLIGWVKNWRKKKTPQRVAWNHSSQSSPEIKKESPGFISYTISVINKPENEFLSPNDANLLRP